MPQELEHKALKQRIMAWQKFPIYFPWSIILHSLCTDKIIDSCHCTIPMTETNLYMFDTLKHFCTNYVQLHSQQEYTIVIMDLWGG